MRLEAGGIDVWYIDESQADGIHVLVALPIPFLRDVEGQGWTFVWKDHLDRALDFRRTLSRTHSVPVRAELHASKFLGGRGRYKRGGHQFTQARAVAIFAWMLANLGFLPPSGIITVVAEPGAALYGATKLEASLHALFQRMQRASVAHPRRNGLVFFDEGHGEYRRLYRKAQVYLPTGSLQGGWHGGALSKNVPMNLFTKDANFKDSQHSQFIQLVDLVAYAALSLLRGERQRLSPRQAAANFGAMFDLIPTSVRNLRASRTDRRGIVRLK